MKILFLCVNYNSYPELTNYLNSIEEAIKHFNENIRIDVIVADNTETTQILPVDISLLQTITIEVYKFNENLGYLGAIEKLIKIKGYDQIRSYDYTILSNVDLIITNSFFSSLLNTSISKKTGWIAPQIYSLTENRDRNPKILKRPSLKHLNVLLLMYKFPILHTLYTNLIYRFRNKKLKSTNINKIYAGHGSFMIFTKSFMKNHADFKFPSFLFGEEIFFGELIKSSDLYVIYKPEIVVHDIDHASTGKLSRKTYCKMNYESLNKIKKQFYNE